MAELTTTKLNAESHLLLVSPTPPSLSEADAPLGAFGTNNSDAIQDQQLLRLPHELLRKNFKTSQRLVEREREFVLGSLKATATASLSTDEAQQGPQSLAALDTMISRMQGLKRKLEALHDEEKTIHEHSHKRIQHLQDLYEIPNLMDVKYDEWSKIRLNRLLVDYMLRSGYGESARALAREKHIEELVDVDVFVQCHRIEESLRRGRTQDCLLWCNENKQALRKNNSNLEFELRLQQYIELVRSCQTQKLLEATHHARKYLAPHRDTQFAEIHRAAGLLAFTPDTQAEPYKSFYSPSRWTYLASLFLKTHHDLFALPDSPLLHIALSAGLSSLKTPSCHSAVASSSSNASSTTTSVCPICSTELNQLARNVPYAHHTKSNVESDPIVLPNGRVYGRERLVNNSVKLGLPKGMVKDPTTGDIYEEAKIKKVFIM
ncbi:MAG: GID complex subunit containing RING finger motif [Sarea resinae]|nr:MAG: GID complex subunit containing RING finger motif [Sarea resinae]